MLAAYAKAVTLMGGPGAGQLTKMVNQICIAGLVQALAEGINFAGAPASTPSRVLDVIGKGAAQSWQMDNRGRTMVADKFDFGFAVDWMRKDLGICLAEARAQRRARCRSPRWSTSSTPACRPGRRPLGHVEPGSPAQGFAMTIAAPVAPLPAAGSAASPIRLAAAALTLCGALATTAVTASDLVLEEAWVRPAAEKQATLPLYVDIRSSRPLTLTGATSPIAGSAALRVTDIDAQQKASTRRVETLPVAGGTATGWPRSVPTSNCGTFRASWCPASASR